MTHTYKISGMTCQGCRSKVEKVLNEIDGISAKVTLEPAEATVTMEKHIPTEKLQEALSAVGNYRIEISSFQREVADRQVVIDGDHTHHRPAHDHHGTPSLKANKQETEGVYYCPMHCEGEKTYHQPGICPVCGMDLLKQPFLKRELKYTCPMHPEIIRDQPGSCPICGMDLVPVGTDVAEEEDKTYDKLLHKFKIAALFPIPIFIIAMTEMTPNNPLFRLMELRYWNWVQLGFSIPVVFYATWMFFERAWRSIITWNLNMFTLIGIGAGVAWLLVWLLCFFQMFFPISSKHTMVPYMFTLKQRLLYLRWFYWGNF